MQASQPSFPAKEVADFILKLYTILERPELQHIICWSNNGSQIQIRDQKKLEDSILPTYFRHNKMGSFIRQLNMYSFSKVNKVSKEKKHMFFRNDLFKKGSLECLHLIRRKRKGHQETELVEPQKDFEDYKVFIKSNVLKMQEFLSSLGERHPQVSSDLTSIINIAGVLISEGSSTESISEGNEEQEELSTEIIIGDKASKVCNNPYPIRSLNHFDSRYSLELNMPPDFF